MEFHKNCINREGIGMRKFRKSSLCFIVGLIILSILIAGCTNQVDDKDDTEQQWDYKPMISKENYIYGDTGRIKETLPEEFVYLGKVEDRVSQTEPMVKGRAYFVSNTLPINTGIYGNKQSEEIIYAEYNDSFIRYELIEE